MKVREEVRLKCGVMVLEGGGSWMNDMGVLVMEIMRSGVVMLGKLRKVRKGGMMR